MSDSIVRNSSPTAPIADLVFVSGYAAGLRVENILHRKLNGSGHDVVYKPVRLPAGRLTLHFATSAHAWAAIALLMTPYTFTLTADVAEVSMTFVLQPGDLTPRPAATAGDVDDWTVEVPFQEVTP